VSPLPKALQDRLTQHAAVAAAVEQGAEPGAGDPAAMLAFAKIDAETPDPFVVEGYLAADGAVDFSVFAVPTADPQQPRPAAVVVAETPAPFTADQLRDVQKINPDLAMQVFDTQKQVSGLTAEIAKLREHSDKSTQLQAKVAELEAINQTLRAQQAAASALSDGLDVDDLTDEERALFQDPRLLKTIQRVADTRASAMARRLAEQTQSRLDAMEGKILQASQQAEQQAKASRESTLRAALTQAHPDAQTVFRDPAFADYLKAVAPFSRDTLHARLNHAWQSGDMAVVSDIIGDYKRKRAEAAIPPAVPQHVQTQPSAAPSYATTTHPAPTEKPMLSARKYAQASQMFRNGNIPVADFDKIRAAYDEALRENRVVDDRGATLRG